MQDGGGDQRIHPFGPNATGTLISTPTGHVSATLMEPARPVLAADVMAVALLKQNLRDDPSPSIDAAQTRMATRYFQAAAGYMHYGGTYEIADDIVTHHVEQSLYPEWVGTDLDRTFSLVGRTLRLTGDAEGLVQHLVWERVHQ